MKLIAVLLLLPAFPHLLFAGDAAVRNPDSPFGVICPWSGIRDAGIKWVRCGAGCTALDWGAIEKERGVFDWKNADAEVCGTIRDEGVDLLPILGYTPKWASSGPNGENAYPPRDLCDWSDFVYRIVSRYKDKIKYWEVWNEEDIGFWQGTVEQYVDLLKSAYVAAKKADPTCRIVLGGTAGVNMPFMQRVYENGGKYYFDVMAVHPYQWGDTFNDEWFCRQLRDLYALMRRWGDGHKEVWITEFGWSTGDSGITDEIQARLLAQGMITCRTLGDANITRYFWFCVRDWGGPGYGLYGPDGKRKPSFDAYRIVSKALEGTEYVGPAKAEGVRCHRFRKDGRLMLAIWSPDKSERDVVLPEHGGWTRLMHMDGTSASLRPDARTIRVGPEPVFVYSLRKIGTTVHPHLPEPSTRYGKDVWYGLPSPRGTSRLWVARMTPEGTRSPAMSVVDVDVLIEVHNDSERPADVRLEGRIGAFRSTARTQSPVQPGQTALLRFESSLPAAYRTGLDTLHISGEADGVPLPPTKTTVRIADGSVIEFTANSTVENRYLFENQGSGGAPSVRFNGRWTYKFDLSKSRTAVVDMCVGAHQANDWQVLASSDNSHWKTILSGRSNRSWHSADLTPYAGGPLYLRFEGNDQQLSELVLRTQ